MSGTRLQRGQFLLCGRELLRQIFFPATLLHGCRNLLHLAGKRTCRGEPFFQPCQRFFQQRCRSFQSTRNLSLFVFRSFPSFLAVNLTRTPPHANKKGLRNAEPPRDVLTCLLTQNPKSPSW